MALLESRSEESLKLTAHPEGFGNLLKLTEGIGRQAAALGLESDSDCLTFKGIRRS